jgi:putative glutamine amidotransferase
MMADAPLIGIPTLSDDAAPGRRPPRFSNNQAYTQAVLAGGGVPVLIPLMADPAPLRVLYRHLDGLLLPGGVDVDPALYGAARDPATEPPDPLRNAVELRLLRWALADGLPVLAICRGLQVLNVACGGTLWQDLDTCRPGPIAHQASAQAGDRALLAHPVTLAPDSRLAAVLGAEEVAVNTLHHQGLADLGADLQPVAWAPDGLCEGLELPGAAFVLAVQWHPEELVTRQAASLRLFTAFCRAAADRAAAVR